MREANQNSEWGGCRKHARPTRGRPGRAAESPEDAVPFGVTEPARRIPLDVDAYVSRVRSGPCFICVIVAGDGPLPVHIVFRDDRHIAFLNQFPTFAATSSSRPSSTASESSKTSASASTLSSKTWRTDSGKPCRQSSRPSVSTC